MVVRACYLTRADVSVGTIADAMHIQLIQWVRATPDSNIPQPIAAS